MKKQLLLFIFLLAFAFEGYSQTGRQVHGIVADSSGVTIPGVVVKLKAGVDSAVVTTNIDGVFTFNAVTAKQFSLTFLSIGFQGLKRNFTFDNGTVPANIGMIKMKTESKMLTTVQITDVNAIKIKEDTTEYKASAYPVRANASTEELVKKLPGVDVDANGNVTAEGKQVTKVRINGKDFFGGDVQTATKNLPADVIESIQMIDDYGDQANLTGIKSGEATKVMNIVIRKDKNYGYSVSGTAGDGRDAIPAPQSASNRYTFSTNSFEFRGDQQIALLGSINNNNTNTFNFGGGGGGGGGFGGGGGGGRGNGGRGGGGGAASASTTASTSNGITDAKSIGLNYRDQWGKTLSVYGSYSFSDNSVNTISSTLQKNNTIQTVKNPDGTTTLLPITINNNQNSKETDGVLNHRITWNMEWKPDTVNYLKITPTYSYGSTTTNAYDLNAFSRNDATYQNYYTNTLGNSNTNSIGGTVLYNHRFNGHGRNFSITANGSSSPNFSYQNPVSVYLTGNPNAPQNQFVTVDSHTNSFGTQLSYIEPLSKVSFLEGSYTYSYAHTTNDKEVDTLTYKSLNIPVVPNVTNFYDALSNNYNYSFITNRFAVNYRLIEPKYNFTLGLGVQPSQLKGVSPASGSIAGSTTTVTVTNFSPTLRYVYNFSRTQAFTLNYNGSSSQPTYSQLNPRLDISNASYPIQGNPNLRPSFTNNVSLRYNQFSFASGDLLFTNLQFSQVDNYIAQNSTTYPRVYAPDKRLNNAILITYANTSGYYTGNGFITYAKPWNKRKYTLILNGGISYVNNISYISNVDSVTYATTTNQNTAKSLTFTPGVRFRLDITDVIDAQASASYGITKTNNTLASAPYSDYRTTVLGVNGKNYFWKDWTLSYDYSKTIYDGYSGNVTNPNILTTYVERRFLKNNAATIRGTVYDVFNENTGYTNTTSGSQTTTTNVNRLGRYFLLTFTLRLQKFAGKAPSSPDMPGGGRMRRDGGQGGPPPGGGGFGGPGGGPQ
ncbi:outer membrane receptor protein involved in Fe transport [Mucilaginibacter gracilis]|uniref:Outer membrane receptor protein involved in Fe transport n=1 Tax=Mucilaginibacter gracilis TaxID=423350 RepID=A0A495IZ58_9SPHI|nr:TonB-dependent receptor [Mucilaginibacter gracilis]RKR81284.1 outer membrane receptor protein involved in Fe transport [Mucilaginibacter gracilis]